jgi:hypothetical protein
LRSAARSYSEIALVGLHPDASDQPSRLSRDSAFDFVGRSESEIAAVRLNQTRTMRLDRHYGALKTLDATRIAARPDDVSGAYAWVDGDQGEDNWAAIDDCFTSSEEDVLRMPMSR